ncbi:MAG: glycosyltransferase family 4 protein [Halobacteriota archaeon]|nr:glycosyltransferase family 4 protein [Halobacteriota archaeon]
MNIIQVSAGIVRIPPERGGAVESHIVNITKHLSKENKVTIIDRKYNDFDENEFKGIKIHRIFSRSIGLPLMSGRLNPIINEYLFSKSLLKCEIAKNADIIHAHNIYTANASLKIANDYVPPFVYTCHNGMWCTEDINLYERKIVRPIEKKIIEKSKVTIAVSENLKKNICEKTGIKEEKIVVIYNGVDSEKFNTNVQADDIKVKYGMKDSKIVLFVGRVAPAKGVEYLIKAANLIANERNMDDVKFLIVGPFKYMFSERKEKSDYAGKLMDLVKKYSLQDNFIFTDAVPEKNLPSFYAAGDLFVLPSIFEAFPMVLIEAMASGKAVIGSNVGGISEVIINGENGFLFEPKNYKELAERILILLKDENFRNKVGNKNREIVEKKFEWEKITEEIIEVYKRCMC